MIMNDKDTQILSFATPVVVLLILFVFRFIAPFACQDCFTYFEQSREVLMKMNRLGHEKTVFGVSDLDRHKTGCTVTLIGLRLDRI